MRHRSVCRGAQQVPIVIIIVIEWGEDKKIRGDWDNLFYLVNL